jgi:hypothetical protein
MRSRSLATIALVLTTLGAAGGIALAQQDRSTLKVPDGLAFSEFKGYETWQGVASSQTKDQIKMIVANSAMIAAYKQGLPAKGKTFPDGVKIVKIEWALKANTAAPYTVNVPGDLQAIAMILKDTKRFPKTHGWAYAVFEYDAATKTLKPQGTGADCGFACHTKAADEDYIFTHYPVR